MIIYETFKYATKQELIDDLDAKGWEYDKPLRNAGQFVDTTNGERLDYAYMDKIVLNYPATYPEPPEPEWTPVYSADVYIHTARIIEMRLEASHKLDVNATKYFNNYINKFVGEATDNSEEVPDGSWTKGQIKAWLDAHSIVWGAGMTKAQLLDLVP